MYKWGEAMHIMEQQAIRVNELMDMLNRGDITWETVVKETKTMKSYTDLLCLGPGGGRNPEEYEQEVTGDEGQ